MKEKNKKGKDRSFIHSVMERTLLCATVGRPFTPFTFIKGIIQFVGKGPLSWS